MIQFMPELFLQIEEILCHFENFWYYQVGVNPVFVAWKAREMDAHHENFRQEFVKFYTTNPIKIIGLIGKFNK